MASRVEWIDYAKAIGIVLVVYGHSASGLNNAGIVNSDSIYMLINNVVYSFHMPLFFFLSGLFFFGSLAKRGAKKLIFSKIDSLVYPYLLWSVLQGGVEVGLSQYTNGSVTAREVLTFWEPRAQFWFLYALFFVFVVSVCLYSLVQERYHSLILSFSIFLYLGRGYLPDNPTLIFIYSNFVYFVFGVLFTKYEWYGHVSRRMSFPALLVLFVFGQYMFHGYLGKQYTQQGIELLLLSLVSIALIVSISSLIVKRPVTLLAYIGASTMAIYVMHILAGSGVRVVLSKFWGVESATLHIFMGCSAGICLPMLANLIITRFKIPYIFSAPVTGIASLGLGGKKGAASQ